MSRHWRAEADLPGGKSCFSMRISFCTTCANRLPQFEATFASNYAVVRDDVDVQWLILNFASADDVGGFMRERLPRLTDRLIYAELTRHAPWHASVAKNLCHRLAFGDILVNLDCDNYIGDAI